MNREVVFYQQARQQRAGIDFRSPTDLVKAALYVNTACELARSLEIEGFNVPPVPSDFDKLSNDIVLPSIYALETFLSQIYARHLFEIDGNLKREYLALDKDWRAKATSYVSHIREAVNKASDLPAALRQSILDKLNTLQKEIDRNRSRITAAAEIIVELSEGIAIGAKGLKPAIEIVERLLGAWARLRRAKLESAESPNQLPSPESLGLPDFSEENEKSDEG